MKKLFCICYLFLVLCGTFPWITSCSGDDVEEVVSVKDVPFRDIEMWFHTAKNYQKMNYYHRMICKS